MQLRELKQEERSSLGFPGVVPTWPQVGLVRFKKTFYIGLLAVLAVIFLAWPIWRAPFPIEIDGNEAWNAYHVDDVLFGRPLYPSQDDLLSNNYPPLSFHVVAFLAHWLGDPIYVGRLLSLVSTLELGGLISFCVVKLGGGVAGAVIGGLWFIATMARFFTGYVGMNDPHLPALCIAVAGLAWFLARDADRKSADGPILLMV